MNVFCASALRNKYKDEKHFTVARWFVVRFVSSERVFFVNLSGAVNNPRVNKINDRQFSHLIVRT